MSDNEVGMNVGINKTYIIIARAKLLNFNKNGVVRLAIDDNLKGNSTLETDLGRLPVIAMEFPDLRKIIKSPPDMGELDAEYQFYVEKIAEEALRNIARKMLNEEVVKILERITSEAKEGRNNGADKI